MKKYILSSIFCLTIVLPFTQVAHGVPTEQQLRALCQAIKGGNQNTINLFNQLYPIICPPEILDYFLAKALLHGNETLMQFFTDRGADRTEAIRLLRDVRQQMRSENRN